MRRVIYFLVALVGFTLVVNGSQQGSTPPSQPIVQSIEGTTYTNKTANFTLTVPENWKVSSALDKLVPGIVGTLVAPGGSAGIMVQRFYVLGPKAGAQSLDSIYRGKTKDYRKLSEGPLKIDGKESYFFEYRALFPLGPPEQGSYLPARLMVVLIPNGESVLGFHCRAPEAEFEKFKPVFDKIVSSYKSGGALGQQQEAAPSKAPAVSPNIQQSIQGTTYDNKTANFTLTVPEDWKPSELFTGQVPGLVGALMAPGGSAAIMIQRYYFPGAKAGAAILDSRYQSNIKDYRKLSEGPLRIGGKDSYFFVYRALFPYGPPEEKRFLPARVLVVLIPHGESVLGFLCQAPESEFDKYKPVFDKIVGSFKPGPR
jgi:hypothetical protein